MPHIKMLDDVELFSAFEFPKKKLDRIVSEKRKSIKKPIRMLTMRQIPQYE